MNPARIRKLAKAASNLSNTDNYEAVFALRWVAYEGLMLRAAGSMGSGLHLEERP